MAVIRSGLSALHRTVQSVTRFSRFAYAKPAPLWPAVKPSVMFTSELVVFIRTGDFGIIFNFHQQYE